MSDNEWHPAISRYRVTGTFRVRVYSPDQSDIQGTVTEHECSHIVETADEDSAIRAATEQHYRLLDATYTADNWETMGWKAQPMIVHMGIVKPAQRKQAQYSLFDMEII